VRYCDYLHHSNTNKARYNFACIPDTERKRRASIRTAFGWIIQEKGRLLSILCMYIGPSLVREFRIHKSAKCDRCHQQKRQRRFFVYTEALALIPLRRRVGLIFNERHVALWKTSCLISLGAIPLHKTFIAINTLCKNNYCRMYVTCGVNASGYDGNVCICYSSLKLRHQLRYLFYFTFTFFTKFNTRAEEFSRLTTLLEFFRINVSQC
jgi:hypothetical protein